MPAPTFNPPVAPSPGTSNKPEHRILTADFGDGYSQASPDGINSMRRTLTVNWDVLHPMQCKTIMEFFDERRGCLPFLYTPSNEAEPKQWTCKEYSDKREDGGMRSVAATFKQDFNIQI